MQCHTGRLCHAQCRANDCAPPRQNEDPTLEAFEAEAR
jgi:hypothetical protein